MGKTKKKSVNYKLNNKSRKQDLGTIKKKENKSKVSQNNPTTSEVISSNKKMRKISENLSLRERMMQRLQGARFRYLNEQMYTKEGKDAKKLFKKDPQAFQAYHEGFKQQVTQWEINPLDTIISHLRKKSESLIIADFGCGDARLASSIPNTVHSFDLVAMNDKVTVCDIAHTPLKDNTIDIVVFCLSLMGTNLSDFILEANRVLKINGLMKIAEVESRFENVDKFISTVKKYGFNLSSKNLTQSYFYFLTFKKVNNLLKKKKNALPPIKLKPCIYKKR